MMAVSRYARTIRTWLRKRGNFLPPQADRKRQRGVGSGLLRHRKSWPDPLARHVPSNNGLHTTPQMPATLNEPLDLIRARVHRAAGAHQAIALMTQHPHHGARVEVTVREEYAASRKCSGHLPRIASGDGEGQRGRALATRRQTVELDSGNGAQALPLPPKN